MSVRRRLTDPERRVLSRLSIETVVDQLGCGWEDAVAGLQHLADEGKVTIRGDDIDAYLFAAGRPIVYVTREDLAAAAIEEAEEHPA